MNYVKKTFKYNINGVEKESFQISDDYLIKDAVNSVLLEYKLNEEKNQCLSNWKRMTN